MDKDLLNKAAYAVLADRAPREVQRFWVIEETVADATGNEPIFDLAGKPAGKVLSGSYGYHNGQSLALAYLRPDITRNRIGCHGSGAPAPRPRARRCNV